MQCSICGDRMPFDPVNWIKLTESNFRTYVTNTDILVNRSAPYWVLCPTCYGEIFLGCDRYIDKTVTKTETETLPLTNIQKSAADVYQEPIHFSADKSNGLTTITKDGTVFCSNPDNFDWDISNTKGEQDSMRAN